MEKLTEKLKYVLEDCIDCISPIQQEVINKAVDRLAAYEETGLEPEEIELLAKQRDLYVDACGELPLKRIRELAQADREKRIIVIPKDNNELLEKLKDLFFSDWATLRREQDG